MKEVKSDTNRSLRPIYFKLDDVVRSSVNSVIYHKTRRNLFREVDMAAFYEFAWKIKISQSYRS